MANELAQQGLSTVALSGDLNQSQRNQIMDGFSKGQQKILITTDLASRGLDLVNVSHVINFDLPKHCEEFVHRIGRTGRAGNKGDSISLVGPKDWLSFKNIEGFLQMNFDFSSVDGLKAKFSGLKPKQDKAKNKAANAKKKAPAKNKSNVKKTTRKIVFTQDAGDMPVMRRKQKLEPKAIDTNSNDEVE